LPQRGFNLFAEGSPVEHECHLFVSTEVAVLIACLRNWSVNISRHTCFCKEPGCMV
jgi:hypothetical protein